MLLKISTTLYDEMEPAMEDAVRHQKASQLEPTDSVYLKLARAPWRKSGILLVVDAAELTELRSRASYKIEVALENMDDEPAFWRGQLAAWRALLAQIAKNEEKELAC